MRLLTKNAAAISRFFEDEKRASPYDGLARPVCLQTLIGQLRNVFFVTRLTVTVKVTSFVTPGQDPVQ